MWVCRDTFTSNIRLSFIYAENNLYDDEQCQFVVDRRAHPLAWITWKTTSTISV